MSNIDIEKLLKEAKILYWKEDEVICHKDTIGILSNIENTENIDNPLLIQYSRGD